MAETKLPEFVLETKYVDKKDFDSFKKENSDTLNKILSLVENSVKKEVPKKDVKVEADGANAIMPKQYQNLFEKYFDSEDGFTGRLTFPEIDENGKESGGLTFSIFVPDKFSNATDAWKQYYKKDIRVKALSASDLAGGIEKYCQLVSQNLHYDKNIKRK